MIWNRSVNYALAVVSLADYLTSDKKFHTLTEKSNYKVSGTDVLAIQVFANQILNANLTEDGKYGSKTSEAIKKLQKKWKMPQDGVPDYLLISKIKKYKSRADFMIPPQPRKPKTL